VKLRPYQQEAIDQTMAWMRGNDGNLVCSLATGSGKSVIIGEFCRYALEKYPHTRILMLVHTRELIAQNHEKLKKLWFDAPVGIYSAGLNKKQIRQITYAGIQSIHSKHEEIGHVDLVLVDECHLISHKAEGTYRKLLDNLKAINPHMRVIGYSATPYRLGHGYIHEGSAIFDDMIEPVTVKQLIDEGYLCKLRSKFTQHQLDTTGVKKSGGEYVEKDLQMAVNTDRNNTMILQELLKFKHERKSWLVFCSGIEHAEALRDLLVECGIDTKTITGKTKKVERDSMLKEFKQGKIQCLTSVNVISIGFDAPNVDLLAMVRPTMSPSMYVQQAGRGLRISEGKEDCIVLDFAGNISQHGPITNITPPKKKGDKPGEAPIKVCEHCQEIVHLSVMICPACGKPFPPAQEKVNRLHQDDIMGQDRVCTLEVKSWKWQKYTSKKSGKTMLKVIYYGCLSDLPVTQYFTIYHDGGAGHHARIKLFQLLDKAGVSAVDIAKNPSDLAIEAAKGTPPKMVKYEKNGKFFNVIGVEYAKA
jgi:DNA repair protein RadD